MMAFFGILTFVVIRLRQSPARGRGRSRFSGSHPGAAWLVLFMIFNVMWTLFLYRGAQINPRLLPVPSIGAFATHWRGKRLHQPADDRERR